MIRASVADESVVVQILSESFKDNSSVNYIVRQDHEHLQRLQCLMEYSFRTCLDFGRVYISEDRKACALVLFPDRKKVSLKSIWRDVKLVLEVTGVEGVFKVLRRETLVQKQHPVSGKFYYIWFVGVLEEAQGKGLGTQLMEGLFADAERMDRPVYLETSTLKNIPWYEKFGFKVFHEIDIGYRLFFLKRLLQREN